MIGAVCRREAAPVDLPDSVQVAYTRAERMAFDLSSEPEVGWLLASLSAAVPPGGRVLEIGTGAGVGLAWIVHGLGDRSDVEVVTVESDPETVERVRSEPWPEWVRFEVGDGAKLVGALGQFDLVFPDAPGGKIFKLRKTVAALRPGGVLVVDDMDLSRDHPAHPDLPAALHTVRDRLVGDPALVCAELSCGSGIIVATRRR
jgi:predicted O-methyltransferase YrrM